MIRFKNSVDYFIYQNQVLVRNGEDEFQFGGEIITEAVKHLFPHLTEGLSLQQILSKMDEFDPESIETLLDQFDQMGLLQRIDGKNGNRHNSGKVHLYHHEHNSFRLLTIVAEGFQAVFEKFFSKKMKIQSDSGKTFNKHEATFSYQLEAELKKVDFVLVFLSFPDSAFLRQICKKCEQAKVFFIPNYLDINKVFVGPVFQNSQTFKFYNYRMIGNSPTPLNEYIKRQAIISCDHTVWEANDKWDELGSATQEYVFHSLDTQSFPRREYFTFQIDSKEKQRHSFTNFYTDTDQVSLEEERSNWLEYLEKTPVELSIEETLKRIQCITDNETGILKKPVKYTGSFFSKSLNHYYKTEFCIPRIDDQIGSVKREFCSGTGGGERAEEAKIKSIGEALERYASMLLYPSSIYNYAYKDIAHQAVNPEHLILYEADYYDKYRQYLSSFNSTEIIPWVCGFDLLKKEPVFVPADFITYPRIRHRPLIKNSSTGTACHSNFQKAIETGIFELIERDAFMLTWLKKLSRPRIAWGTLPDRFLEQKEWFAALGYDLYLIDLTSDLGFPTIMGILKNKNNKWPALFLGASTSLDPLKAAQKAILELEMQLLITIRSKKEDYLNTNSGNIINQQRNYYFLPENASKCDFLFNSNEEVQLTEKYPINSSHEVMHVAETLNRKGFKVFAVDLTKKEFRDLGLKVFRIIIPGLQPLFYGNESRRLSWRRIEVYNQLDQSGIPKKSKNALNLAFHPFP